MVVSLNDVKELFHKIVIPFHMIQRDITLPLPDHRPDNDAEHSWSLSLLAIALAPEIDPKLDTGKIAIFAALHDIVEVYAGDTSVWADQAFVESKTAREAEALARLKTDFPAFPMLFRYIDAYEEKATDEAKFVYALDKFINMLSIVEDEGYYYRKKYKITKPQYDKQLQGHREKAHAHPLVGKYYDELRQLFDSDPEHFYPES